MRFLLDTHVFLWLLAGNDRLSEQSRDTLADSSNSVLFSVVSGWEIAIKVAVGRLALPPNVRSWLPSALEASGLDVLPVHLNHTLHIEHLPLHHADPFDRLLIAQALAEDLTLVSADQQFGRYDVQLLAV